MADAHRNLGNEAFKKGFFISAIHFYTKGIKVNCNDKELKAKLYNNRAIAHLKLGKTMRVFLFFFLLLKLKAVISNFLKKVMILNVCPKRNSPEKYIPYLGHSNIHGSNIALTPDINDHHKVYLKLM